VLKKIYIGPYRRPQDFVQWGGLKNGIPPAGSRAQVEVWGFAHRSADDIFSKWSINTSSTEVSDKICSQKNNFSTFPGLGASEALACSYQRAPMGQYRSKMSSKSCEDHGTRHREMHYKCYCYCNCWRSWRPRSFDHVIARQPRKQCEEAVNESEKNVR